MLAKIYQNVGHLTSFLTSEVGIVRVLDCCNLTQIRYVSLSSTKLQVCQAFHLLKVSSMYSKCTR